MAEIDLLTKVSTDIEWIKCALKENKKDHEAILEHFEKLNGKTSRNTTNIKWLTTGLSALAGAILAFALKVLDKW